MRNDAGNRALQPAVPLGDVSVFDGTLDDTVAVCRALIAEGRGGRIATANLDFFALARRDPGLRRLLQASTLVVADGAPVAWLARLAGGRRVRRVAGVDLCLQLLATGSEARPLRVALYGSTEEISSTAARAIEQEHGGRVQIVARMCPPFRALSSEEVATERARIVEARPDLVLVALGCPRQEERIAEYFDCAPQAVWVGIGGTLDFVAGRKKRAPRLAQALGLEWMVRLVQDPVRLWRRYLLRDIPEVVRLGTVVLWARRRTAQ